MAPFLITSIADIECRRNTEVWPMMREQLQAFWEPMFDTIEKKLILSAHLALKARGLLVKGPGEETV